MKVTILSKVTGEPQPMDVDVVSVVLKDNMDTQLRMFFCPNCQNPIVQYVGQVVQILPGATPSILPIVAQCRNASCRTKYLFERIVSRDAIL